MLVDFLLMWNPWVGQGWGGGYDLEVSSKVEQYLCWLLYDLGQIKIIFCKTVIIFSNSESFSR